MVSRFCSAETYSTDQRNDSENNSRDFFDSSLLLTPYLPHLPKNVLFHKERKEENRRKKKLALLEHT